jgi:hypothetical protein
MVRRELVACQAAAFALTIALAVAVPTGSASANVSQTPIVTGCPTGWEHLTIEWLLTQAPYQLPGILDAAGNNNGSVCAVPLPDAYTLARCGPDCPASVLYVFIDDNSQAQQHAQAG